MLDKIIDIAKQAGEVAKIGFNGKFDINFKSNSSDLVTDYDKKTEKFITDFIKKEFPNHQFWIYLQFFPMDVVEVVLDLEKYVSFLYQNQ